MTHALKIWPQFYQEVEDGNKTFEVRKNDRDFKTGDVLLLQEWDPVTEKYTGNECYKVITYILPAGTNIGIHSDYVVMSIAEKTY
jgi:hypothetical protein